MAKIISVKESYGFDYYVYHGDKLIRVCPSIGMAREVASGIALEAREGEDNAGQ